MKINTLHIIYNLWESVQANEYQQGKMNLRNQLMLTNKRGLWIIYVISFRWMVAMNIYKNQYKNKKLLQLNNIRNIIKFITRKKRHFYFANPTKLFNKKKNYKKT